MTFKSREGIPKSREGDRICTQKNLGSFVLLQGAHHRIERGSAMVGVDTVSQRFISIGCNRTPNVADSSNASGRIAFGAHNTVALWNITVPDSLD